MPESILKQQKTINLDRALNAMLSQPDGLAEHKVEVANVQQSNDRDVLENAISNNVFVVYTTGEVDAFRSQLQQRFDEPAAANGIVDQRIAQAHERVKEYSRKSVDNTLLNIVPIDLIETLKAAILTELRIALNKISEEMQSQLDSLRQSS